MIERKLLGAIVFALITTTLCVSQEPVPKPTTRAAARSNRSAVSDQLKMVQDQLKDQQAQLAQQRALVAQQQAEIGQLEQVLRQNAAELRSQGQQLQRSLQQAASLELNTNSAAATWTASANTMQQGLQETQKALQRLEHPTALHYKGITLVPGGFISADFFVRSRNENADLTSNFGATPFGGVVNSHLSEFRASSRGSRLTLLAEGKAGQTRLTGYYEIDFLAQAPTANQVQTNSFSPRQRQLWAQADFNSGLTLTAGQYWSLITTDRKGIATRSEFIPNTLEASYVVGYNYSRQTAFRLTKNFNNRVWAAFELANPETAQPNASFVPANLFGFNNSANASSPSGSTLNFLSGSTNGFSTKLAPDLLVKVAWEPGWGHYELKAVGRFFRDRINGNNNLSAGGGLGAAAILPVVRNQVDFIVEGLAGTGIGRYGAAAGLDVTLRPDGHIIPIHALQALAGIELHPQPKLDIFLYGGDEYYGRAAYLNPTDPARPAGFGSPLVDNRNCQVEIVPSGSAACGAQNRDIWHATTGFWYRFYKGPFGVLQYGAQYEYLHRGTWAGIGGAPKGLDSVMLTSIRYFLP